MAGFLGNQPPKVPLTSADIADGTVTANDLNSTLNLSSKTVTLPASSVTSHVTSFDDSDIRSDILHLAIAQSLNDNRIAFSLEDSFVDTFEDSSGIDAGGNLTNVARDTTGEYVSSIYTAVVAFSNDSNTKLLLHMDDTGLTDSSSGSHAATLAGNTARSSTQSKFGSYSVALDGTGDYLTYGSGGHSDFAFGTGDFTLELWYYPTNASKNNSMIFGQWGGDTSGGGDGYRWGLHSQDGGLGLRMHMQSGDGSIISSMLTVDAWTHIAVVRSGTGSNNMKMYKNGVQVDNWTNATSLTSSGKVWMSGAATGGQEAQGFIDEARISNVARYSGTFTPNEVTSTNATGTLISDPQTASTSRTSCSGVIIYEDAVGTSTLGTDLKIYFTANNGTNWTEAASYGTATTYSGTKKLVKLGATTVTAGTQVAMKAVWANQSGSKEARLHGWAVNY